MKALQYYKYCSSHIDLANEQIACHHKGHDEAIAKGYPEAAQRWSQLIQEWEAEKQALEDFMASVRAQIRLVRNKEYQEVLEKRYLEGMTEAEILECLGYSRWKFIKLINAANHAYMRTCGPHPKLPYR